jgi:hypothetical protein
VRGQDEAMGADSGRVLIDQLCRTRMLGTGLLLTQLCDFSFLIRVVKTYLRFGELSRAPLKILRLQVSGTLAECDWMARSPDAWDQQLPASLRDRHASMQALKDALAIREAMLCLLPQIDAVTLRVYRAAPEQCRELIITGTVAREDEVPQRVSSVVMRAKLCGLHFVLDAGVLAGLPPHYPATV